jgi:KipI family sensor histidine kinase inhibitor
VLEGFYLRFGEGLSEEANRRALALAETLLQAAPPGLLDAVPAYGTLYLEYDPRRLPKARLLRLLKAPPREEVGEGRVVEVPVRYDGEDLREVAGRAGLSVEAVKALHQKPLYRVYALGFTPGFPFMAPVEPPLRLPRRPHPRPRVPAHSVAVAGPQTGIYPLPSPGGWNLLGTSLVAVYDPHRPEPFLLRPGDRVRFREAEGLTPEEPPPLELLPEDPLLPAIRVEEAGLLDLVVDGGRFLAGRYGLARSGPLDPYSARVANALVGNPPGAPLLEVSLKGPVLTALRPLVAALAGVRPGGASGGGGGGPGAELPLAPGNGPPPPAQGKGSPGLPGGGGGPRGQALPGLGLPGPKGRIGRPLKAGDVLGLKALRPARAGLAYPLPPLPEVLALRLLPGPQHTWEAFLALLEGPFRVARADRVGLELEGPEVPGGEGLSEPTPLGGVQVPPSGRPLVLLADKGSLGGYTKPALVDPRDLWLLGQAWPGVWVRFRAP